ncbi:MAG: NusA N-terminal domain-containing protein, partial [Thermoanaerobaculia bacterium]
MSSQPPADSAPAPEKKKSRAPKGAAKPRAKAARAAAVPPATKADEIIEALKAAARDKEIEFDRLVAALEEAIATAARKVYKVREMAARFDPATGLLTAWTPYRLVEQKTKPEEPEAEAPLDPDDVPLGAAAAPVP